MFKVIEELMNRFIEFLLQYVSGETSEARLANALRTSIVTITALFWIVISLTISSVFMKMEILDLQSGLTRINTLFDPRSANNPFSEFIKLNNSLVARLDIASRDKDLLSTEYNKALSRNQVMQAQLEASEHNAAELRVSLGLCRKEDIDNPHRVEHPKKTIK